MKSLFVLLETSYGDFGGLISCVKKLPGVCGGMSNSSKPSGKGASEKFSITPILSLLWKSSKLLL